MHTDFRHTFLVEIDSVSCTQPYDDAKCKFQLRRRPQPAGGGSRPRKSSLDDFRHQLVTEVVPGRLPSPGHQLVTEVVLGRLPSPAAGGSRPGTTSATSTWRKLSQGNFRHQRVGGNFSLASACVMRTKSTSTTDGRRKFPWNDVHFLCCSHDF